MHKKLKSHTATKKRERQRNAKQKIPICCIEKPKKHEDEKSNFAVNKMKKKRRKRMIEKITTLEK